MKSTTVSCSAEKKWRSVIDSFQPFECPFHLLRTKALGICFASPLDCFASTRSGGYNFQLLRKEMQGAREAY